MSFNLSRAEKTEGQLRKPGRSGNSGQQFHYRGHSGVGKVGGGGAGGGTGSFAPPPSSVSSSLSGAAPPLAPTPQSFSTSRSFKKPGGAPSSQYRVNPSSASSEANVAHATHHPVQNGSPDAKAGAKAVDMPTPRNATRAVPKAPASQNAAGTSTTLASATPKGDASKPFTLQFGTISPGIMKGVQIPARTSSAPPNLDEQKRDQARNDSFRAIPTAPVPTVPKQQQQQQSRKDVLAPSQSGSGELQPPPPVKRDVPIPVPPAPTVAPPKPSVLPMPIPFQHQQPQVPLQFGGPNPQIQPQGLGPNSLQMTMTLPVGSASQVPQQFLFHSHLLPQQAIVHQGQGLGFAPAIGHQLPPQLGNLGMGYATQFPQQQPGKFVGPRKTTVKITHPETHEELRLDKRTDSIKDAMPSGHRPIANVTPQSQPISPYNFYSPMQPNSLNPSQLIFPTSVPLPSSQMSASSQPPRYSLPVNQTGQPISFMTPSMPNVFPGGKPGPQTPLHGVSEGVNSEVLPVPVHPSAVQVTVKPPTTSQTENVGAPSMTPISMPINKAEMPNQLKSAIDATPSHQRQGEAAQDKLNQQKNPAEPRLVSESVKNVPLPGPDSSSSVGRPVLSIKKIVPDTSLSFSAPVTPVADSGEGNDGKKREIIKRSDSLKDNQKKASKNELRSSQQQQQLDSSNTIESLSIPSPQIIKDNSAGEMSSSKLENIKVTSASSSASSVTSLTQSERGIPSEIVSKSVEDKELPASSYSSGTKMMNRVSSGLANDGASCETSISFVPTANENIKMAAYLGQADACLDVGRREKMCEPSKDSEVSNDTYEDSGDAKIYSASTTNDSSGILYPSVALEKGNGLVELEEVKLQKHEEAASKKLETSKVVDDNSLEKHIMPTDTVSDTCNSESSCNRDPSLLNLSKDQASSLDALATEHKIMGYEGVDLAHSSAAVETVSVPDSSVSEVAEKLEFNVSEMCSGDAVSTSDMLPKEKPSSESSKPKITAGKKKKKKDICAKADAAGTTNLYNAYMGLEENHQTASSLEIADSSLAADANLVHVDDSKNGAVAVEEDKQNKTELDDWEDAADVSTPKLKPHIYQMNGETKQHDGGNEATTRKRYSKDFLLTLQQQFTELPIGFAIGSDMAEALMSNPLGKSYVEREPYPSPGRITDRPSGASRVDRRMVGTMDDDRWSKSSGSFGPGRDLRLDVGHGSASFNLRSGQGSNHGVPRNARVPSPNHFTGGILTGPMQPLVSSAGMPRGNSGADRWQHVTGVQRGLIPSPQTPLQVMHRAEKKYEVGKVSDEEEAKQRQLKAILNKLTPQNFEKLFAQVKEVGIDNAVTLTGLISQIFDKALMEPTFCEMYANFCVQLAGSLPDFSEDNEKITFRRLLLNKCQEEFERGEQEQAEASKADEEGEIKRSKEEREQQRVQARRRMLGNIRLIGELYKKKMLTDRIMHECINKLLGQQYQNPDEEDLECLCKLMSTIGEIIDHPKAKELMDAYFNMMGKLSTNSKLSSRVRFMLKDVIDLRRNKWQQRRKVEGPKKIEEVHRDAAQERQAQSSRSGRGPATVSVSRRGGGVDHNFRGSTPLTSSNSQMSGGIRGLQSQVRGFGPQDVRSNDRHQFESKTLSLPQRSVDDDSITLGPQGGLGRGMSIRGQPLISNPPTAEIASSTGDHLRISGQNGFNPPPERTSYNSQDTTSRYTVDRIQGAAYNQPSFQDRNTHGGSRDFRTSDRTFSRSSTTILPAGRTHGASDNISLASETKMFSQDVLREKSMLAIREFYSAKDEEEVALCIKELNSPSFYASMLSLWITDSFERKDIERDLLAKLIVNLCSSRDSLVSQVQLIEGFKHVLVSLEDAVNDAPRAAEFLGRTFAKAILEKVITLSDIGKLIHEGGEEPGRLREIGLAAEVLGSTLESIRAEKGDSALNEITSSSNLHLEDFRPPLPMTSKKLDAFL